jgi:hypothetical protein
MIKNQKASREFMQVERKDMNREKKNKKSYGATWAVLI